ncbi:MAG TPA: hypothetical protein VLC55_11485, partial [Burkholderiales bacterium]|nr:hypothetical protein [Burkholderiales bacterium]
MSQRGAHTVRVTDIGEQEMDSELLEGMQPQPAAQREAGAAGEAATGAAERYLEGIRALHRGAIERGEIDQFVAALTRALAWVIFAYDSPAVTGD